MISLYRQLVLDYYIVQKGIRVCTNTPNNTLFEHINLLLAHILTFIVLTF